MDGGKNGQNSDVGDRCTNHGCPDDRRVEYFSRTDFRSCAARCELAGGALAIAEGYLALLRIRKRERNHSFERRTSPGYAWDTYSTVTWNGCSPARDDCRPTVAGVTFRSLRR